MLEASGESTALLFSPFISNDILFCVLFLGRQDNEKDLTADPLYVHRSETEEEEMKTALNDVIFSWADAIDTTRKSEAKTGRSPRCVIQQPH